MRLILGDGPGTDPLEAFVTAPPARTRPGRPWVLGNMVASIDGATAIAGESRGLSGPADRRVFHRLRAAVDAIMAAAGTVRADRYGPARPNDALRAVRVAHGLAPVPPVVVVSRGPDLDWGSPLVTEAEVPTVVLCPADADPAAVDRARVHCRVVQAGAGQVDLAAALAELHAAHGVGTVLCEGGPGLIGQLAAAGLLDELFLTVSPLVVAGEASRAARGPEIQPPARMRPVAAAEEDGFLFLRYVRDP